MSKMPVSPRHPCPGGCGRMIAPSMLACAYHWRLVPASIKAEVWRTWKARQQQPFDSAIVGAHLDAISRASALMRGSVVREEEGS